MLSVTRFEKISGHAPQISHSGSTGLHRAQCVCDCDCGTPAQALSSGWHRTETRCLEELREAVLSAHRQIAMDRADWKCEKCRRVKGLSAHHKKFRSHGRRDLVQDLEALCSDCHREEHRG